MRPLPRSGTALLELLLAIGLLGAFLATIGPLAARAGLAFGRGRILLEGVHLAQSRRTLFLLGTSGSCPGGIAGRDSGQYATVEWTAAPQSAGVEFLIIIRDHPGRFPPETLATVLACAP